MIELSRRDARRAAVRAQLLTRPRPTDLVDVVRRLGMVKVEQTAYTAPSADLVLWSRLGRRYSPARLEAAVAARDVVEMRGMYRAADDVALFLADMAAWPGPAPWQQANARWLEANRACADEVLDTLRDDGPLPARDLPSCCARPWRSSGWNSNKDTTMLLEQLEACGRVAVSRREGAERWWDLAERVHPRVPPVPADEAARLRDERRLAALGVARSTGPATSDEPWGVGAAGEPCRIEGIRGTWRVDPAALEGRLAGRTALLSPFDRLVLDRKRLDELFELDYALEMYKPAEQRIFGYYALPILHGDRLVGTVDAAADHRTGTLTVQRLRYVDDPAPAVRDGVETELRSLAAMLGLTLNASRPA